MEGVDERTFMDQKLSEFLGFLTFIFFYLTSSIVVQSKNDKRFEVKIVRKLGIFEGFLRISLKALLLFQNVSMFAPHSYGQI